MKILKSEKQKRINKRISIDESVNLILNINESMTRKIKSISSTDIENTVDEDLKSVDLGLSVKWAKSNLGTNSETDFGDFYGWGMTTPYKIGVDDTDKVYKKSSASIIQTDLSGLNDVATVKLGKGWRMPTQTELKELKLKCDWEWIEDFNKSGHNGYKVMKKSDHDVYIFLPAAGNLNGLSHDGIGSYGFCWCSSRNSSSYGWGLLFYSSNLLMYTSNRYYGFSVRPVRD